MLTLPKTWAVWLKGLIAAFIAGGASAGSSWMGMSAAHAVGLQVPELNFTALGIIFLSSGVASGLTYLKESPVPRDCWTEEQRTAILSRGL